MLLEFVPEKSRSHAKLCKKMKKRKQLDALVSCSKPKRFKNSSFANSSSHGLLKNCSDSSDLEDFSLNRKRRPPKHVFTMRKCNAVFSIILFILVTACIIATATLVWLHLILRSNLEILRLHLQKVESTGEETPRNLHSLHSKIQTMTTNIEAFQEKLEHTSASVTKNEKELSSLRQTSAQLQESLASAPEIHGLPKTIQSLSENLATIGSKILALETIVKDLKVQLVELRNSHQQEASDLDIMKSSVHQLWKEMKTQKRNVQATKAGPNTTQTQLLSHLQEEVQKLNQGLGSLNGSLVPKTANLNHTLNLAMELFSKQQKELGSLHEIVFGNATSEVDTSASSPKSISKNLFINCNVSGSQIGKLLPELEEIVAIYEHLKHQLNVSHVPATNPLALVNATLHHYFLQNPKIKSLFHRVSALETGLAVQMEELKTRINAMEGPTSSQSPVTSSEVPVANSTTTTTENTKLTAAAAAGKDTTSSTPGAMLTECVPAATARSHPTPMTIPIEPSLASKPGHPSTSPLTPLPAGATPLQNSTKESKSST